VYQLTELVLYWLVSDHRSLSVGKADVSDTWDSSGVARVPGARDNPRSWRPSERGSEFFPSLPLTFLLCCPSLHISALTFPVCGVSILPLPNFSFFPPTYPSPYLPCAISPIVVPPCGPPSSFKWGPGVPPENIEVLHGCVWILARFWSKKFGFWFRVSRCMRNYEKTYVSIVQSGYFRHHV
jgi:hypothetical protein